MSTVVVVIVTETATPTPNEPSHSSIPPGVIAGIVIGTLVGGVLLIAFVFYLFRRYGRHRFTRVANPHDDAGGADLRYLPSTSSRRPKSFTRHLRGPSVSSEPLMSTSQLPLPTTSRILAYGSPPRLDLVLPGSGGSPQNSFDLDEINKVISSKTSSYSSLPSQQTLPGPLRPGNTPPLHTRRTSGDDVASTPSPPRSPPTLFLNRMIKSRAQASEDVSLAHRPSLDIYLTRSTTLNSSNRRADEERTALGDAERAQMEKEEMADEEVGWEEAESTESIYSQSSAPIDHSFPSESVSSLNNSLSVPRRRSSRRHRAPVPSTELAPVVEAPDSPITLVGQNVSPSASTAVNSSLDAQLSHWTASHPFPSVVDQPLPLLTSSNFGRDTLVGSISSNTGRGSTSSASRYPSLAPSSSDRSCRLGPRPDVDTDWHHPPPGLAGLTSLRIGPLQNPHSPVDELPERQDLSSSAVDAPVRPARLRESTASSIAEVEKRDVMQGGIASIDVVL